MFTMVKLSLELFILTEFLNCWTLMLRFSQQSPTMFVYIFDFVYNSDFSYTLWIYWHIFYWERKYGKIQNQIWVHSYLQTVAGKVQISFIQILRKTHSLTIAHTIWDHRFWHLYNMNLLRCKVTFLQVLHMVLNFGTNTTHNAVLGLEFSQNMCRTELAFWGKEKHFFSS